MFSSVFHRQSSAQQRVQQQQKWCTYASFRTALRTHLFYTSSLPFWGQFNSNSNYVVPQTSAVLRGFLRDKPTHMASSRPSSLARPKPVVNRRELPRTRLLLPRAVYLVQSCTGDILPTQDRVGGIGGKSGIIHFIAVAS